MTDSRTTLHLAHLDALERAYATLLDTHGYDGVLLYSGHPHRHFGDDQEASFATYGHFLHWIAQPGLSHSWLLIRPGQPPLLRFHAPADFWHLAPQIPNAAWTQRFTIETATDAQPPSVLASRAGKRLAVLGDVTPELADRIGAELNPPALTRALDELRVRKSDYEIDCLSEANRLALAGHHAARDAFLAGGAELDIQLAYLGASRQRESEVPYQNIVGLNAHAGVLHYQHYDIEAPEHRRSLLVDAGHRVAGYAADITRTWAGPAADTQFAELISGVDALQQALIAAIRPGVGYVDLHHSMHHHLGELLRTQGLVRCSAESAVESGITRAFCPHGLGHLLGLQVHDVAGRQDPRGEPLPAPENDPALRLTRELEAGMAVTMEPGLYFIPLLLEPLRDTPAGRDIDWQAVGRLMPHGGIRIEDNVVVGSEGPINLTR
ncbi:Xaa-Pro dipeptidase [Modicisalibacter muralis]|uniref:Xaa-Pro dipeptidase n=1 Tax=Modicisalibacter muralis TaxID=119000 RepID=A0A1G9GF49_9GAMM|nr:Xaa-Pro dipeptidase [Halomonas muralis]SDK99296.1 Xaa-Pro dipeptidase [Halomonas muralis]